MTVNSLHSMRLVVVYCHGNEKYIFFDICHMKQSNYVTSKRPKMVVTNSAICFFYPKKTIKFMNSTAGTEH